MDCKGIWEVLKQKFFPDDDTWDDLDQGAQTAFIDFLLSNNIKFVERRANTTAGRRKGDQQP